MAETKELVADSLFQLNTKGGNAPIGGFKIGTLIATSELTNLEIRDALVTEAGFIEQVAGQASANQCTATIRRIKSMLDTVEAGRTKIKAPVIKLGKEIDTKAKEFAQPLQAELDRLSSMLNLFTTQQFQKAEAERIRKEKEAQELERQRQAAETPEEAEQIEARQQVALSGLTPAPIKVADTQVRRDPKFDVTDILALYAARPDLCNPPTPNLVAIKKAINDGLKECPGLANITIDRKIVV